MSGMSFELIATYHNVWVYRDQLGNVWTLGFNAHELYTAHQA